MPTIPRPIKKQTLSVIEGFYRDASKKIVQEINSKDDFSRERRLDILRQTNQILGRLDKQTRTWVDETVRDQYTQGSQLGLELLADATSGDIKAKQLKLLSDKGVFEYATTNKVTNSKAGLEFIRANTSGKEQTQMIQAWTNWVQNNPDAAAKSTLKTIKDEFKITPRPTDLIRPELPGRISFSLIDENAIKAIADETYLNFGNTMRGMENGVRRVMSEAEKLGIRQRLAEGKITGESRKQTSDRIAGLLKEGFIGMTDKGGRVWDPAVYARMLARTKMMEATNSGLANRLLADGYDLVQVSSHRTKCPLCGPYGGAILSLTGKTKEYDGRMVETLDQAKANGLLHPNCEHRILPFHPRFAEKAGMYAEQAGKNEEL